MKAGNIIDYICCPKCKSELKIKKNSLMCVNCASLYKTQDGIVKILPKLSYDTKLSIEKWEKKYKKMIKGKIDCDYEDYLNLHAKNVIDQLKKEKIFSKKSVYLEIGCGPFFLGQILSKYFGLVIGIDFSGYSLKIANRMFKRKCINNFLLIQGNVLDLPIKSNTVDLVYGSGVIEHFTDTEKCIKELFRVLKTDGVCFNTVPLLNVGSLTYRQIWGNIPNIYLLKQIAEFVHVKLLKGKHMRFGYEMSFLKRTLINIHRRAGFSKVDVDRFNTNIELEYMPKPLRGMFAYLARNSSLFWPFVKVCAKK